MAQGPTTQPAVAVSALLELNAVSCESVDNIWATVTLDSNATAPTDGHCQVLAPPVLAVDFVVVIDASASMQHNFKLVTAALDYLLRKLDPTQRLSLIIFNQYAKSICELLPMTHENKAKIAQQIPLVEPAGATNIVEAVLHAIGILNKRPAQEQRLANIMLFTDGLSRATNLDSIDNVLALLSQSSLPENCVINTFGFGTQHDSLLLYNFALCGKGVYYYVNTFESIAVTFGECIAGILSTRVHGLVIRLRCQEGARITTLATPYPIAEVKKAKDYDVSLGVMFYQEVKSLLFRISVRKVEPTVRHNLAAVSVEYYDSWVGKPEQHTAMLGVSRPPESHVYPQPIPLALDEHINRYTAAKALTEAIMLARSQRYQEAQAKLGKVIDKINTSYSSDTPYCRDLVEDVLECLLAFDTDSRLTGVHNALTMSSMYFMERSVGTKSKTAKGRNNSYGYTTIAQYVESQRTTQFMNVVFKERQLV